MPQTERKNFLFYYQQFKNKIFNYFWYRTGFNQELTEDLTADVFLRAYEHFEGFNPAYPFQSWIFAIAHNHLVNFYKKQYNIASLAETAATSEQEQEEKLLIKLDAQIVQQALVNLPAGQQDLIIMHYINDLSIKEIAEILQKEENAARVALSRALDALRRLINNKI